MPRHIRKGDTVYVRSGSDKGATGKVTKVLVDDNRVVRKQRRDRLADRCRGERLLRVVFGRPCHCFLALDSGLGLVGTASSRR